MSTLALLSTLTPSGWVLLALTLAETLDFVAFPATDRDVQRANCAVVALLWVWLLWLLTPVGAS